MGTLDTGQNGLISEAHAPSAAVEELMSLCYGELRGIARRVLSDDGAQLHIQPTDLAHEAALRLMRLDRIAFHDRTHFLALSARVMRQALLDEIRRHKAAKRAQPEVTTSWSAEPAAPGFAIDQFDDALKRLFAIDADRARIIELRFYAGLTMEEIATVMELSLSTVERRWRAGRAWLITAMADTD